MTTPLTFTVLAVFLATPLDSSAFAADEASQDRFVPRISTFSGYHPATRNMPYHRCRHPDGSLWLTFLPCSVARPLPSPATREAAPIKEPKKK